MRYIQGDTMLYINRTSAPRATPTCPPARSDAIFPGSRVPADQSEFVDLNRFIFADIS